ncbi:MAG TPA: hypothetical protein VGF50_05690 [Caulobacteraceae bacterium]
MDAPTVIEIYVRDVTQRLPRRTRDDVALELRALLTEELAARAVGEPATEAMAIQLVRSFGAPGEVAARYRPATPLLDAADTRPFLTWAIVGALVLAAIAPITHLVGAKDAATVAILAWLGLLVLFFATRNWARRRSPSLAAWRPRDPDHVNRVGSLALVAVIALGAVCYGAPAWVAARFTGGPVPAWMARVAYAPDFQATRLPWLLALWAGQALLFAWLVVEGRWRRLTRRVEAALALAVSLALIWFLAAGPIFQAPAIDRTAKAWLALIALGVLADAVWKTSRLTRPPSPPIRPGTSTLAV